MKNLADVTMLNSPLLRNGHEFIVSDRGSLIAGIMIEGRDAAVLSQDEYKVFTHAVRNIINPLPLNIVFSTYYINAGGFKLKKEDIDHPISKTLSDKRIDFLNQSGLKRTSIFHMVEIMPDSAFFTNPADVDLWIQLLKALYSKSARQYIVSKFSDKKAVVLFKAEINRLHDSLVDLVDQLESRLEILFLTSRMNKKQIWGLSRYLSTFDSRHLYMPDEPPKRAWSNSLDNGDVTCVTAGDPPCSAMLNRGVVDRYIRYASVIEWTVDKLAPAMFYCKDEAPLRDDTELVLMVRWRCLNSLEQNSMFNDYKNEIGRANMSFVNMMTGRTSKDEVFVRRSSTRRMDELDEASNLEDRWGYSTTHIAFSTTDPNSMRHTSNKVDASFGSVGATLVWESAAMPLVRAGLQPHLSKKRIRELPTSSSQFAAMLPIYNDHIGRTYDKDLDIPALIILTGSKNVPFWYHPYGPSSVLTIGVGPTGSGKTFLKNSFALNFGKYPNSIYRAIDIDPGSEPVAELYGGDGHIFRLGRDGTTGFNPFSLLDTVGVQQLQVRLKQLVVEQLAGNEALDARTITTDEEKSIESIASLLCSDQMGEEDRNYPAFVSMLQPSLTEKLSSFIDKGMYADVWGGRKDAIGNFHSRYGVYNLSSIKKDNRLKELVMSEIFWRCQHEFENPDTVHIPKCLDIDEAVHLLRNPKWREEIVEAGGRRWRKFFGHITLWTQDPDDYVTLPNWNALRGATGSFFFMADPEGDADVYREGFGLTRGEINTVMQLKPRSEALIRQPWLGVSRVVRLLVDEEQYALTTSQPIESNKRRTFISDFGFEEGLKRTVDFIRTKNAKEGKSNDFIALLEGVN